MGKTDRNPILRAGANQPSNIYAGIHQTHLFSAMVDEYNAAHPAGQLIKTSGSDDHQQPNEGLEMGKGRNGNLLAEFGRYAVVTQLRTAQARLMRRP